MKYLKRICREIGLILLALSIVFGIIEIDGISMTQLVLLMVVGIVLWLIGLLSAD